MKIDKPAYYYRRAKICLKHIDKKGRVYYEKKDDLILNSNSDLTFHFSDFKYKEFYIVIDNEDNPPLENIELDAFQLNRYLITHLESKNGHRIVFGNEDIHNKPNYDITHFKNKIRGDIPLLRVGKVLIIQYKEKKKVNPSTLWMWGAIGIVALLLAYMSFKMITEMEKK